MAMATLLREARLGAEATPQNMLVVDGRVTAIGGLRDLPDATEQIDGLRSRASGTTTSISTSGPRSAYVSTCRLRTAPRSLHVW